MARSPSSIYKVKSINGYVVDDLRVTDVVMQKAQAGMERYQKTICMAFRNRVKKAGKNTSCVNWSDLSIVFLRAVPASDTKKPAAKKP